MANYQAHYDQHGRRWVIVDRNRGQTVLSPCTTEETARDFAEALNDAARRRMQRQPTDGT